MSKLTIELGGKYSAGEMFKRAQGDVKQFGKDTKDVSGMAQSALKEISTVVDKDVGTALKGMSGILQGMVTGGIFGMVAAAATTAFELIKSHIEKAKEEAKKLAEAMDQSIKLGFTKVKDSFAPINKEVNDAKKNIEDLMKVAQGERVAEAKTKVAQLHIETLQKITDGMSEAGKKAIEAQEKYEAEVIKQNSALMAQADIESSLNAEKIAIEKGLQENTNKLATARSQLAEFEAENSGEITEYQGLLKSQNETIKEKIAKGWKESEAIAFYTDRMKQKAEFEEKHKAFLEEWKAIQETIATGEESRSKLLVQQNEIDAKLAEQKLNESVLREEGKARLLELDIAARQAQTALQNEATAAFIAAEQDQTKAEWAAYIYKQVSATEEEYLRLQEAANAAIEDGLTTEEITQVLQEEWNQLLTERNELVTESNKLQKEENEKKKKGESTSDLPPINIGGSSINATIQNTNQLGNEIGKEAKNQLNLDNQLQKNRDKMREVRDIWTNVSGNSNFLKNLVDNMKSRKWSKDHLDEWANEMLKFQQQHWTPELAQFAKEKLGITDSKPLSFVDAMEKQALKERIGLEPQAKKEWEQSISKIKQRMTELQQDKQKVQKMYTDINTCATEIKNALAPKN